MTKVAYSPVKKATKRRFFAQYSSEDIAVGFIIGVQCALALSVILYHLI